MSMLFAVGMFLCGLRTQSSACLLTVVAILTQAKISNLLRVSRFSSPDDRAAHSARVSSVCKYSLLVKVNLTGGLFHELTAIGVLRKESRG